MSNKGKFSYRQARIPTIRFNIGKVEGDAQSVEFKFETTDRWVMIDIIELFGALKVEFIKDAQNEYDSLILTCTKVVFAGGDLMKEIIQKTSLTIPDVNRCRGAHRAITGMEPGMMRLLMDITPEKPDIQTAGRMSGHDEFCQESRIEASRIIESQGCNDSGLDQLANPHLRLEEDGDSYKVVNEPYRLG